MVAIKALANARFPVITALVVTAAATIYGIEDGNHLFLYDRNKVLDGDIWRVVTGHLVHFSWQHFGYNLILLVLTGCWLEYRLGVRYVWLLVLTSLVSGLYFLLFLPDMAHYGGLSGLVSANVVYLSLLEIQHNKKARPFWIAIILLFIAKVGYEMLMKETIFVSQSNTMFEVAPSAHIIGAIVALIYKGVGDK